MALAGEGARRRRARGVGATRRSCTSRTYNPDNTGVANPLPASFVGYVVQGAHTAWPDEVKPDLSRVDLGWA